MEVILILICIIACIIATASSASRGNKKAASPAHRTSGSPPPKMPVQFRCRPETKRIEEIPVPLEMLTFEVSGLVIEGAGAAVEVRIRMVDKTDGSERSVLCGIEDLQAPDSLSFLFCQDLPPIPFGSILNIDSFTSLVSVPLELLLFPYSGHRDIIASLEVRMKGRVIRKATTTFKVHSSAEGYVEGIAHRERSEEMGIYLAMHLASADGNIDKKEADVVKEWIRAVLDSTADETREDRKDRLNLVISDAFEKSKGSYLDLDFISEELEKNATLPMKYEIMELCMDVMKADGVADPSEIRELKRIATMIGLDEGRYTALLDKRLAGVQLIGASSAENLASIVGITPEMDKDQIRKHLNKEYRKWNARVSHDDEKIRARAEQMIEHIAEARKQYI